MIKHLIDIGQDELREELALLVRLNRAVLNFSPMHGPELRKRFRRTFFLDQAFCNQLGFHADKEQIAVGLPSQEFDLDVFDAFSKIQSCCGFLVHPLEYLFLVMHAGTHEVRQTNTVAIALPLPRAYHDALAGIGRITFAKMDARNFVNAKHAISESSFDIEVRRDKSMFWEEPAKA